MRTSKLDILLNCLPITATEEIKKMKTTRIVKQFDSIKKAERFQNSLYNKYDHVQLVQFPNFSESGQYVWEVATNE